jgi:antitoxin MazE
MNNPPGIEVIGDDSTNPREGWDEAFRQMAENGDDALLDGDLPTTSAWDDTEWEW